MEHENMTLADREVEGWVLPMGPFNLVLLKTENGMIGCGAFDVKALEHFDYPAARISGVATTEDLLNGQIVETNQPARKRGIKVGMTGREAIAHL